MFLIRQKSENSLVELVRGARGAMNAGGYSDETAVAFERMYIAADKFINAATSAPTISYYEENINATLPDFVLDTINAMELIAKEPPRELSISPTETAVVNIFIVSDLMFSIIAWEMSRKVARPDIKSLFADRSLKKKELSIIDNYCDKLSDMIGGNISKGIGSYRLNFGACERDCTSCPIGQNCSTEYKIMTNAIRAKCPIHLGRQFLFSPTVTAMNSVAARTILWPPIVAHGNSCIASNFVTDVFGLYKYRIDMSVSSLEFVYKTLEEESLVSVLRYMQKQDNNLNDVSSCKANGIIPPFVPEMI